MKKIILALTLTMSASVWAADMKMGFVDFKEAIALTKSGKKALKKLTAFQKKKQKSLDKKKASMDAEQKELEKKFAVYSQEKQMKAKQDFQRKAIEAERFFRSSQMELVKKEKALLEPISNGLRKAIEKYAKKEGYSMIFEKNASSLLFATKAVDLTAQVVKTYGK